MSVSAGQIYFEILNDIQNAIRDSSAQVISPYSLTTEDINRINRYFQTCLEDDDIVCLVSNSILNIGKSGAVFTKDGFYYKGWMSLQISHEYYWNYDTFDNNYNIFYDTSLREVMRKINEYIVREERKEQRWNAIRSLIGQVDNLAGVLSYVSNIVMNIMHIFYKKDTEKTFCELYKYTGLIYREPRLFTIGDSVNYGLQIQQLFDFTDEVINDLNSLKDSAYNDSLEYLAKVLLLSATASLFLLKTNQEIMSIEDFVA